MVISQHHKYIFIAVPRTGSNSVARLLLATDATAQSNVVPVGDRAVAVSHHVTASKLKALLGDDYERYFTFGFVRSPRERFVSVYSYYHHGDAPELVNAIKRRWLDHGGRRVLLARALPFRLWSMVYPYTPCSAFLADRGGRVLVDRVGRFESFGDDVHEIMRMIGLDPGQGVPRLNSAEHLDSYPTGKWFDRWFAFKFRRDRPFYPVG